MVLRQRVGARLLDDGGDHGGLRRVQLGHLHAVVRLGRRLDPVGAVTQVDRVEVVGEDPLLGLLLGHLDGHEDLLDLAAERLLGADADVVLPDELLGDGRAALQRAVAARGVRVGGPHDAGGRDAALVEEIPVLGGEHRVDDGLGDLVVGQHLPVGGAESADEGAVLRVDHGLREAGGRHRVGGHRRLLIGHGHRDGAEHDQGADTRQQHAHGLLPRPVPPPVALDLDPGPVQPAAPRSAEAPRAARPSRPAGTARAIAAACAAGGIGSPQGPGGLGFPPQLAGLLGACRSACRARVAAIPPAPGRAAVIRTNRRADPAVDRVASGTNAGALGVDGLVAVEVARFRAAEPLRVPALSVIAQVVVDIRRVALIAPAGRRAAGPHRAHIAIPNVKVISFAAHASSLVARRSRLMGKRPLLERRVRSSREPAKLKRYLLGQCFTGWSAHAASGVPQARQCPERRRKQGGSTRNFGRLRPHRPGIRRIRPPFRRVRGLA